jgi:hypothetical protein
MALMPDPEKSALDTLLDFHGLLRTQTHALLAGDRLESGGSFKGCKIDRALDLQNAPRSDAPAVMSIIDDENEGDVSAIDEVHAVLQALVHLRRTRSRDRRRFVLVCVEGAVRGLSLIAESSGVSSDSL